MSLPNQTVPSNQEGCILLAIQAIKLYYIKSIRAAAISYDIPPSTLCSRINRVASRRDSPPNSQKLTPEEELAIIRYILDLDSCGFPPWPQSVRAYIITCERFSDLKLQIPPYPFFQTSVTF
jgi:hypothetical protein